MGSVLGTASYQNTGSAVISEDGKYRYHLWRRVSENERVATFIMLNPSTADACADDATIRKCLGFCRRWGCGELHVVNLFAFRATDPRELGKALDPVGPGTGPAIRRAVADADLVVCAWGIHGGYLKQGEAVVSLIRPLCKPMCLGVTRDGRPRHPLFVPYSARLVPFGLC
jgi:hypothetical protein